MYRKEKIFHGKERNFYKFYLSVHLLTQALWGYDYSLSSFILYLGQWIIQSMVYVFEKKALLDCKIKIEYNNIICTSTSRVPSTDLYKVMLFRLQSNVTNTRISVRTRFKLKFKLQKTAWRQLIEWNTPRNFDEFEERYLVNYINEN